MAGIFYVYALSTGDYAFGMVMTGFWCYTALLVKVADIIDEVKKRETT